MSYTSVEHVRRHLAADSPVQGRINDRPVTLIGLDYLRFFGEAVESSSVLVKSLRTYAPSRSPIVVVASPTSFHSGPVARGSVVVASDSSLGAVFSENADYLIDYDSGTLQVRSGGAISAGAGVTVWFLPYVVLREGVDYQLDAERGLIRRLAGGDIIDGETILLDYSPVYKGVDEEILTAVVQEANGLVERDVDPEGQFGADPTLGAAATNRALDIVCRIAATRELSSGRGQDKVALVWLKLADDFARRADALLSGFRPPVSGPSLPAHS